MILLSMVWYIAIRANIHLACMKHYETAFKKKRMLSHSCAQIRVIVYIMMIGVRRSNHKIHVRN